MILKTKIREIADQVNNLRQIFPKISSVDERVVQLKSKEWFAFPRWQSVARTYNEAVEKVLELIQQRLGSKFHNLIAGEMGEQYLCQRHNAAKKLQALSEQHNGSDILIVPAQMNFRPRNRFIERSYEVLMVNESSSFGIGCIILTHPEWRNISEDIWIDCRDDQYAPEADGDFSDVPYFRLYGDEIEFDSIWSYRNDPE